LYSKFFFASCCTTFLSASIVTPISVHVFLLLLFLLLLLLIIIILIVFTLMLNVYLNYLVVVSVNYSFLMFMGPCIVIIF
jgi:hypothetical protein